MNWTGGSLQRTKKANSGVLQQQRAYFAKARTHLHNATNSPIAPFYPDYLRESEDPGLLGISSFGTGSVRHTGHSARHRSGRIVPDLTPNGACSTMGHSRGPPHGLSLERSIDRPPAWSHDSQGTKKVCRDELLYGRPGHVKEDNDQTGFRGRKRKTTRTNPEVQLLEEKRKRLLAQQDWVGIDPSKPVSLRFLSNEDDNIGKRRRKSRSHCAIPRRRQDDDFGGGQPHAVGEAFVRPFGGGAMHGKDEDIKIRIGADALKNTYSTQADEHAQSHASSDPMLFDQESPPALQHPEKLDTASPVNLQLHAACDASEQIIHSPLAPLTGENAQYCHIGWHHGRPPGRDASEQGMLACNPLELHAQHAAVEPKSVENSTPGYRLTHYGHGDARPLRLVFGGPAGGRTRIAPGNHEIGETQTFDESDLAPMSRTEHMHQANIEMEQSCAEEASAISVIVDEEPWKRYLAIFDGTSSHSDTATQPGNSTLQAISTARNDSEAAANWSQYATASRGDGSRASPSSISASLPSLKRGVGRRIDMDANCQGIQNQTILQTLDNDELNWRTFVFGSDDQSTVQSAHDAAGGNLVDYSEDASSMYLRHSRAVSTASPRPANTEVRFASYMRHNAQKQAPPAPPRFRNARSPAFHSRIELSSGEQGPAETEAKAFERRSATHAALVNNASYDLVSSRVVDTTTTSRSTLERLTRARAPCYPPDTTSSGGHNVIRNFRGSCSFYDTPATDDEVLDIVDPNKR
ncbi:hypothetical protein Ptr902_07874 [Pyrenophora tritici-repentis]|nr:hypothetical protein Ptr902_07874 [Pyrenophora tritici-repentis]